jgi:hypothetical protein
MVNVWGVPAQPFAKGVIVIVAVTGAVPVFKAMNEFISPFPLAASPMEGLSFVQLYVVPVTAPLKTTDVVFALLQTVWLAGSVTVGVGLTVIVNVSAGPGHPLAVGVTVIVATTGDAPVFTAVNDGIVEPVPLATKPIEVVLFAQE